jgi:ankyrin repeat protein
LILQDPVALQNEGKEPGKYFGRLLILSVLEDNLEDLQTFLDKGGDPNHVDQDDFTPLFVAVKHDLNDCAMLLVDNGAFVTKKTERYTSPLQLAIQKGNEELITYFMEKLAGLEEDAVDDRRKRKKSRTGPSPKDKGSSISFRPRNAYLFLNR